MLTLTLSSISLTHNKQLDKYNEMSRLKTYRWNCSQSQTRTQSYKKGELFGFYFYGKFIRIHEIIEVNDVLILTQQLIEISWDEWISLKGPNVTKTKHYDLINYPLLDSKLSQLKNMDKKVVFKEQIQIIEIPTAKIMKRFINNLNKEVEYDATLWQIIFCLTNYGNNYNIWKRRDKLLLNVGYYQNNTDIYPGKILNDYKIIAEKYGKWADYIKEKFEMVDNKIIKYNGIKKEYIFLDTKLFKWEYYEKSNCI
jgi:hypothetical protein